MHHLDAATAARFSRHSSKEILRERTPNIGWWHNLSESWLIIDPVGILTCEQLRDAANDACPGIFNMVFGLEENTWAAFGRMADFNWMRTEWDKKS